MSELYDQINLDELNEEAERLTTDEGSGGSFLDKFVIMPKGEGYVIVRLLPPGRGKKFYCATRTHRLSHSDNEEGVKNLHCPRELVTGKGGKKFWVDSNPKDPCPICMYTRVLWAEVEAAGKESPKGKTIHAEYSRIKAIERYYYNCLVFILNKKQEVDKIDGPKILSIGKQLHERIVRAITGDMKTGEKSLGNICDPTVGRNLQIIKKLRPVTNYPYYDGSKFQDISSITDDKEQLNLWLGSMHDLAALRVIRPSSELGIELKKYNGVLPKDEIDTSFNVSDYRKSTLDEQVQHAEVKQPPAPTTPNTPDEVLAEAEFLKELTS